MAGPANWEIRKAAIILVGMSWVQIWKSMLQFYVDNMIIIDIVSLIIDP